MTDDSKLPLLAGYVDDELAAEERAEVERLLVEVPSLQAELESQGQVKTLLATQRPAEPDDADWERRWGRILQAAEAAQPSMVRPWWAKLAPLAAAATVVLALIWWLQPQPPSDEGLPGDESLRIELARNDDVVIESIDTGAEGITVLLMAANSGQMAPVIWVLQEPE